MTPTITYLPDAEVDEVADRQIRDLLITCFTKEEDSVFRHRRYFIEPYPHRWVVRGGADRLVAHVGVHEKVLQAEGKSHRFGGIAEVCVHPDFRGRGYVKAMLTVIHSSLAEMSFPFAVLFGDPAVYGSSGYQSVGNISMDRNPDQPGDGRQKVEAMARALGSQSWPAAEVFIAGPHF